MVRWAGWMLRWAGWAKGQSPPGGAEAALGEGGLPSMDMTVETGDRENGS